MRRRCGSRGFEFVGMDEVLVDLVREWSLLHAATARVAPV
jgi:hypothetical protein